MNPVVLLLFLLVPPAPATDKQPSLTFKVQNTSINWAATTGTGAQKQVNNAVKPAPFAFRGAIGGNVMVFRNGQIIGGPALASAPSQPDVPTLRWKNGESLPGDLAAASTSSVTWKTPLFDDPLQIDWGVLDRIDWAWPPVPAPGPFSIALRDGSFIYGDLASISADSISIHSDRHGDTILKRSEVLSVRRLHRGNLLYAGPTGDVDWHPMTNQQDGSVTRGAYVYDPTSPETSGPGGALLIRSWNRSAILDGALPDQVDVEFHLHSSKRPEFALSLGANIHRSLCIETWDNELVLVIGDQFKTIRKIEDNEHEIALRICWDKKEQKASIFTPEGELVTTWQVSESLPNPEPGLVLQNNGLDLSLDFLRVRKWDGKPPVKIDSKQPHVELTDGRILGGEITAGAPGFIKVQPAATDIPLADVDALVFSSNAPQTENHNPALYYADGTILLGPITSIADGRATIATSFTKEPLISKMDMPRQLLIKSDCKTPETPLTDQDKIVIQDTTLHGKLSASGDAWPLWTPIGGSKSSRLSKILATEITRALPSNATSLSDPALFYLTSGDVLPGTLKSIDRSGAEFESSLLAPRKLLADELNAIQLGVSASTNVSSFGDPGWRIVKGDEKSVRRVNGSLDMDPGTALGYRSLMQSSEISFKYTSNSFSATRLRLFCAGTDTTHSMNLLLANTGNQFISGMESMDGQFENQSQVKTKPGAPVSVRLSIEENQVQLFVNDVPTQRFPIDPAKCAGSGFIIEPASIWGNGVFAVSLSDFSAKSLPGHTWLPEVRGDIKTQVLTVPRFQKDDPPRHLLLAANGDVLRGEIEAATDTHFRFRCGMEEVNVPRDRVRAVIWLKQIDKDAPATSATPSPPNPLDHRIGQQMMFSTSQPQPLISFLQAQDSNLKVKYASAIPTRGGQRSFQFNSQTTGEALRQICSMFDLTFHQEADGTVVIEVPTLATTALPRKTYWLKPDALPKTPSVQEILTAKGITFPKGASVQWQPKASLLSMLNTPENQDKLVALLSSDFGGSQGSPTHWLLLTSGGRLALTVDKFEKDFIIGHNPVYGSCKVPMDEVAVIRTSAPEETMTSRSMEDWQLVPAPEPVLPETGGDSSPLLGKDAATFKLSLLEGGNFDLQAEKGHVVILDFWATWCGPCIKSLPGLIDAMSSFPTDRVKLVGVNQGEPPEQVKRFLETRGLKLSVAMDADQSIGQKYGADAIPHTVIVGPDGKIAWTHTGYDPDGDTAASDVVKRLLNPPSPIDAPPKATTQ